MRTTLLTYSKIFSFLLIFLFAENSFCESGWYNQYSGSGSMFGISMLNENTGYACGRNGLILKTTNGGLHWIAQTTPTPTGVLFSLTFLNENTGWVLCNIDNINYKILRTYNGGVNWDIQTEISNNFTMPILGYMLNSNTIFLGYGANFTSTNSSGYLTKSTNGGANYYSNVNIYNSDMTSMTFFGNTGWLLSNIWGTNNRVQGIISKTTNSGVNWFIQKIDTFYQYTDIQFLDSSTGYIGGWTSNTGIFAKTSNGGDNWVKYSFLNRSFQGIDFINQLTGWAYGYSITDQSVVSKTTNGGENWSSSLLRSQAYVVNKIAFVNPLTGWAVGGGGGNTAFIFKTTNGGVTFINPISTIIPDKFSLSQNYPNPFNPTTKIKFDLPQNSFVKINVFDITGRMISELANTNLNASSYETEFNGTNLSSGIYYYRIEAGNFFETKKMILVK